MPGDWDGGRWCEREGRGGLPIRKVPLPFGPTRRVSAVSHSTKPNFQGV